MPDLMFRSQRVQRRRRYAVVGLGVAGIFGIGFATGWFSHVEQFVPVEGADPTPCITLAIYPAEFVPKPSEVTINVLNGSDRIGMATITAQVLERRGFNLGTVDNFDDYVVKESAEIHYGPAGKDVALLLQAYVEGAVLILDDARSGAVVDVVIGQGFQEVRERDAAQAELARPIASPSGPGC